MTEPDTNASTRKPAATNAEPPVVKIIQDIPVVFVDGVMQHVTAPGVSKFYLFRSDANPKDPTSFSNTAVLQVVIPPTGFVDMVAFFEHRLKAMIQRGDISQGIIDERREFYSKWPIS
jgi:hypothetical protein